MKLKSFILLSSMVLFAGNSWKKIGQLSCTAPQSQLFARPSSLGFDSLVACDEYFETRAFEYLEQFAVLQAAPALMGHGGTS